MKLGILVACSVLFVYWLAILSAKPESDQQKKERLEKRDKEDDKKRLDNTKNCSMRGDCPKNSGGTLPSGKRG